MAHSLLLICFFRVPMHHMNPYYGIKQVHFENHVSFLWLYLVNDFHMFAELRVKGFQFEMLALLPPPWNSLKGKNKPCVLFIWPPPLSLVWTVEPAPIFPSLYLNYSTIVFPWYFILVFKCWSLYYCVKHFGCIFLQSSWSLSTRSNLKGIQVLLKSLAHFPDFIYFLVLWVFPLKMT